MALRSFVLAGTLLALAAALTAALPAPASAQQAGVAPQGRDCQTVRTCNFSRTGAVRGCLSSYSCRVCRPVTVACTVTGVPGRCQEMRCGWGG